MFCSCEAYYTFFYNFVYELVKIHVALLFCLSSRCVDCNDEEIGYRQAQIAYIIYFILATSFDPMWPF
jgi:hypothetical protein